MSDLTITTATETTGNTIVCPTRTNDWYDWPYPWDPFVDPYKIQNPITYIGTSSYININIVPIQVLENEDEYLLQAELPGFKDEEIDISFNNGYLSIKAKRKQSKETHKLKYFGSMSKDTIEGSYALYDVDIKAAKATFENGLLTVVVPKTDAAKPRKIKITK